MRHAQNKTKIAFPLPISLKHILEHLHKTNTHSTYIYIYIHMYMYVCIVVCKRAQVVRFIGILF